MSLRCVGGGQDFASGEAFDLHATGLKRAQRNSPRRCRTAPEMWTLGMSFDRYNHVWRVRPPRNGRG